LYALGAGTYSGSGTFTSLSPGSYVLHIKDANLCVKDTTVVVPDAPPTLLQFNIHKPLCDTFSNGSVIITAYNSVGPYTYARGSGAYSANDTFAALAAGTYTFHIKNGNGCIKDTTLTLVDSSVIHASLGITPVLCHAGTGAINIIGTGGYPAYSYAYNANPFVSTSSFTLVAGTYVMHIKDVNSCHFDTTVTLTQPTAIAITTADTNVHCNGASTGIIVVSATGGTPSYLYDIASGAYGASNVFTGLPAGTHVIGVKDINGCIYTDTVTLTQPSAIHIDSVISQLPRCNGGADGTMRIYASGGIAPYTYANGTGTYSTLSLFTGLSAGSYTLHVQDANGCIKDTTLTLNQPTMVVPSAVVKKSVCGTLANGKVTLGATGGTAPYTYALGTGTFGTSGIFSPLAAGAYTFHIKDAHGCIGDTIITVTDSLTLSALFTLTPALCYNQASGIINVTGTGGVSPYTYSLGTAPYSGVHLFTGLLAGTYAIHLRDTNGCQFDTAVALTQPTFITPSIAITQPSCNGYADGIVVVGATGGTPGYTYSYDNGGYSATTTYSGQVAGIDSVWIRDANGCVHDTVFTISQPDRIIFTDIAKTDISCYGGSDGTVTITGSGATPPYSYALNAIPWQSSNVFGGLQAGLEFVRIQDSHGCEVDTNIVLTQPAKLLFTTVDTLNPTCPGYKDGSATLSATGGTLPYTYSDDNVIFAAANAFTALPAGSYIFAVKDAKGCSIDTTLTFKGIPQIIIDSTRITPPLCYGAANGSIHLSASGGAQPLAYQFNGSGPKTNNAVYDNLRAGSYAIIITDSRNCQTDTTVAVSQPDPVAITDSVTPNECNGTVLIGAVAATVSGGTGPYTYLWNNNPSWIDAAITGLPNGKYTLVVKDANNCTNTDTAEVQYNDCCVPFLPNAFTPNGDGKNEIYRFRFNGDMFVVRFSIYNRFGQEVYTLTNTANLDQGWDGKYLGVNAEMGVYYYYAKIICGNKGDHVKEMKGDVTLIR
jgi:gliding motility-associated-like protein